MTFKEHLKELNLPEEQFNALTAALKTEYVQRAEYEQLSDSLKAAKAEYGRLSDNFNAERIEHKKKIDFIKQSAEDKLERLKGIYDLKLKDNLMNTAIEEAGAKSPEIVRRLIDTDKVELKEDKLTGLTSQITELKKNAPFLFEKTLMYLTGYCPEASSDLLPKINTSDMTYSQAVAYLGAE